MKAGERRSSGLQFHGRKVVTVKPKPSNPRCSPRLALATGSILLGLWPSAASAQSADTSIGRVYSLTPLEKSQLFDANEEATADAALAQALGDGTDRRIHGEVGGMIGTGGARGVFGTAAIPLGENGGAVVSFDISHFGDRRHR